MLKQVTYSFLAGLIVAGILWYSTGRNDLGQIRQDFDRVNGDFKTVQRTVGEVSTNSDGFARNITGITETSERITDRVGTLESGLAEVNGTIGNIITKVDDLERWNIKRVQLDRDTGDLAFDLRRLREESGETE